MTHVEEGAMENTIRYFPPTFSILVIPTIPGRSLATRAQSIPVNERRRCTSVGDTAHYGKKSSWIALFSSHFACLCRYTCPVEIHIQTHAQPAIRPKVSPDYPRYTCAPKGSIARNTNHHYCAPKVQTTSWKRQP